MERTHEKPIKMDEEYLQYCKDFKVANQREDAFELIYQRFAAPHDSPRVIRLISNQMCVTPRRIN